MNARFDYLFISMVLMACVLQFGCNPTDPSAQATAPAASPETTQSDADVDAAKAKVAATDDPPQAKVEQTLTSRKKMPAMGKMKFPAPADMKFKDSVDTNVAAPKNIEELVFTNKDGSEIKMSDYEGKKNVILVFTEGFNGMLCPFCKTQTSRLVSNYDEFKKRDCEVIVVYPGPEDHLDEFIEAALKTEKKEVDKVPFPIVLDEDFAATNFFDIHSKLAHPSTYLIDKQGAVQFAYVGSDMTADRPSIKAMLERLDNLQEE